MWVSSTNDQLNDIYSGLKMRKYGMKVFNLFPKPNENAMNGPNGNLLLPIKWMSNENKVEDNAIIELNVIKSNKMF